MELETVKLGIPENSNLILGQSHFIKTAEDLYEAMAGTAPNSKFGIAFSEASGPCLVRSEGNDPDLIDAAKKKLPRHGVRPHLRHPAPGSFPHKRPERRKGGPGGLWHLLRHRQPRRGGGGQD